MSELETWMEVNPEGELVYAGRLTWDSTPNNAWDIPDHWNEPFLPIPPPNLWDDYSTETGY